MPRDGFGKIVRDKFFTQSEEDCSKWTCLCGRIRTVRTGGGYTNFVSHVMSHHSNDYKLLLEEYENGQLQSSSQRYSTSSFFYSQRSHQLHCWLDLCINGLLPFSIVNNDVFKRNVRFQAMSINTLQKYIEKLTRVVEKKISKLLPSRFAVIFDGWSAGTTHYVAVFASFPDISKEHGYETVMLAFSPFDDETSQSANNHFEYLEFVLGVYDKSWKMSLHL